MLLDIVNAKCWMQEQLDIQLQSLVSYLKSSWVESRARPNSTRHIRYWVGSNPIQPNLLLFDIAKARC